MPKFGEIISSLSQKAGIKLDDDTLKKLLAISEVSLFEVPAEFAQALERNLLTSESAAANPDVRSKIMAEALNGVDSRIETILGDFEFEDTFKNDVKGTKNTYEKLNKVSVGLKQQLATAKEKAKQTKDPADKKEVEVLQAQVTEANKQMENLKRAHEIEIDNLKTANLNDRKEFTLKSALASKPLPKNGLPADVNILTARTLIQQEMAKNNLLVNFDEAGNPVLRQRVDGAEVKYFKDNKEIDYSNFIDGVLAQNKFIQINDPNPTPTPGQGNNPQRPNPSLPTNTAAVDAINKQLQELGMTV